MLRRIGFATLLLAVSLSDLSFASSDAIFEEFAKWCMGGRASGLAPGHRFELVTFVKLTKGGYALLETPYISGVGHRGLNEFTEDNVGTVSSNIFLGEAELDAQNRIVRIIDTSGFGKEMEVKSDGQQFVRLLREMAPDRVAPEVDILSYQRSVQHLDQRLRSDKTDNVRHDLIDPAVTAFLYQVDGITTPKKLKAFQNEVRKTLPILRLYADMLRDEGQPLKELEDVLSQLEKGQIPAKASLLLAAEKLRKTRPSFRTTEENEALVRSTELGTPRP